MLFHPHLYIPKSPSQIYASNFLRHYIHVYEPIDRSYDNTYLDFLS